MAVFWIIARAQSPATKPGSSNAISNASGLPNASYQYGYSPSNPGWVLVKVDSRVPYADIFALDSNDIIVLPEPSVTVDTLSASVRNKIVNFLQFNFGTGYSYTNQGGVLVNVDPIVYQDIATGTFPVTDIAQRLWTYFQQGVDVGISPQAESHNTEYTELFSTNPLTGSRMSTIDIDPGDDWTYDGTNFEMDINGSATSGNALLKYLSSTGSINNESQGTFKASIYAGDTNPSACPRVRESVTTCYFCGVNDSSQINFVRCIAGAMTTVGDDTGFTFSSANWYSIRGSANTNGSQVDLAIWAQSHGTSKPADPGWIGVDNSPTATIADTNAARIVDSDAQYAGVRAFVGNTTTVQCDHFHVRALSDRTKIPVIMHHREMMARN